MIVALLVRLLLFAAAMVLPIVAVEMATFYLMRKYAATIAASLERLTQLESRSRNLLVAPERLGPPASA